VVWRSHLSRPSLAGLGGGNFSHISRRIREYREFGERGQYRQRQSHPQAQDFRKSGGDGNIPALAPGHPATKASAVREVVKIASSRVHQDSQSFDHDLEPAIGPIDLLSLHPVAGPFRLQILGRNLDPSSRDFGVLAGQLLGPLVGTGGEPCED
jgi:hypothetical protein